MTSAPQHRTEEEIRQWIVARLSDRLGRPADEIPLDAPLVSLGVDSMQFVVLVGEMEDWLGCRFASNPLVDHPSVAALSGFLARQLADGKSVIDPASDSSL
jgi:acyl carrier protein